MQAFRVILDRIRSFSCFCLCEDQDEYSGAFVMLHVVEALRYPSYVTQSATHMSKNRGILECKKMRYVREHESTYVLEIEFTHTCFSLILHLFGYNLFVNEVKLFFNYFYF